VLLLDGHTRSSIFGDVGVAMLAEIDRNITVDEDPWWVTVPSIPVESTVEIDARREARIVDVDPLVGRGFHIDSDDTGPLDHGACRLHRHSGRNDRRLDDECTSNKEGRRGRRGDDHQRPPKEGAARRLDSTTTPRHRRAPSPDDSLLIPPPPPLPSLAPPRTANSSA
jgi:hypothetical protein